MSIVCGEVSVICWGCQKQFLKLCAVDFLLNDGQFQVYNAYIRRL